MNFDLPVPLDCLLDPFPDSVDSRPVALFKQEAEDFQVEEIPLLEPCGEGEHLWLWVEKRAANTRWVAAKLARRAGVSPRSVSWAGLKDRHAVTRQFFSISLPGKPDPDWQSWEIDGVRVLSARRHLRKLKTGALRGNRFQILLRDCQARDKAGLLSSEHCLESIRAEGFPNYFGKQRFGHGGGNMQQAAAWLRSGGRIGRNTRSLLISTARGAIFNHLLLQRQRAGNWNRALPGEWLQLAGSRSGFVAAEIDSELRQRLREGDIHPTGLLAGAVRGRDKAAPRGEAATIEAAVMAAWQPWVEALVQRGVEAGRRPLRVFPSGLRWQWQGRDCLLRFSLPAGSYATVLLQRAFVLEQRHE